MKRHHLSALALVWTCWCRLSSGVEPAANSNPEEPKAEIYHNAKDGFQFAVPQGWMVTDKHFIMCHYSDVFVTVDNQRRGLQIREQVVPSDGPGIQMEFGDKIILQQMQPGEIYVSVGKSGGPGGSEMTPNATGEELQKLLAGTRIVESSAKGLSTLSLHVRTHGELFTLCAYLRDPISEDDRRKVMSLVQSFQFASAPVSNAGWAESLAWQKLPDRLHGDGINWGWPVVGGQSGSSRHGYQFVTYSKTGTGYSVEFRLEGAGAWRYCVTEEGQVLYSSGQPRLGEEATEPVRPIGSVEKVTIAGAGEARHEVEARVWNGELSFPDGSKTRCEWLCFQNPTGKGAWCGPRKKHYVALGSDIYGYDDEFYPWLALARGWRVDDKGTVDSLFKKMEEVLASNAGDIINRGIVLADLLGHLPEEYRYPKVGLEKQRWPVTVTHCTVTDDSLVWRLKNEATAEAEVTLDGKVLRNHPSVGEETLGLDFEYAKTAPTSAGGHEISRGWMRFPQVAPGKSVMIK